MNYVKIQKVEKPTKKEFNIGDLVRLVVVFGENQFSRATDFRVVGKEDGFWVGELVNIPTDPRSFESHEGAIGCRLQFKAENVADVKLH